MKITMSLEEFEDRLKDAYYEGTDDGINMERNEEVKHYEFDNYWAKSETKSKLDKMREE